MSLLEKMAEDVVPVANARITAAISYKGDIISFGMNELKSDPFQAKYSKNEQAIYRHAETSAIKNAIKRAGKLDLSDYTLHVCRIKYDDAPRGKKRFIRGLARPCEGCSKAIKRFGIKNTFYTCDDGSIEKF
jgi:tRNA(Arg) A34 adenosine deaminase TadA